MPLLDEKPGIPMVRVRQFRLQLQARRYSLLRPFPIAIVGVQGKGQGQMGLRLPLVKSKAVWAACLALGKMSSALKGTSSARCQP